jgi:hypothetical protein
MTVEIIKCIEIVPKRHAFKTRSYNSAELKNWVDFGSVRKDFSYSLLSELQIKSFGLHCDDFVNTLYAIYTITTNAIIPTIFFINYSPNLILHAVFTQPENDSPSFLACWLICSSKSSSKRRFFLVLFERSYLFFSFFSCTGTPLCVKLLFKGTPHYKCGNLKKQSPEVLPALSRDLTTNIKRSNAMANSNDTLRPKNGQPDLSNLISVLNLYQADVPTHHLLQAENHFEELQQSILYGIGAIGNLMFWASENESYSEKNFKSDMRDIGYLLAQLRDVACFASNQIKLTYLMPHKTIREVNSMLKMNYKEKFNHESKLFKFYDLTTAKVFEALAPTEQQARKSLGKSSLIFIARIRLYPVIERARSFGGYSHE